MKMETKRKIMYIVFAVLFVLTIAVAIGLFCGLVAECEQEEDNLGKALGFGIGMALLCLFLISSFLLEWEFFVCAKYFFLESQNQKTGKTVINTVCPILMLVSVCGMWYAFLGKLPENADPDIVQATAMLSIFLAPMIRGIYKLFEKK
jgi:hypothetical protein